MNNRVAAIAVVVGASRLWCYLVGIVASRVAKHLGRQHRNVDMIKSPCVYSSTGSASIFSDSARRTSIPPLRCSSCVVFDRRSSIRHAPPEAARQPRERWRRSESAFYHKSDVDSLNGFYIYNLTEVPLMNLLNRSAAWPRSVVELGHVLRLADTVASQSTPQTRASHSCVDIGVIALAVGGVPCHDCLDAL